MTLALYRAYRPATLAEVVGQDHVTGPLRRALETGRVHHAYLFSGPRGCGKTSTARILARSLNCAQGPTPDPCGVCDSCVALAPNGPGSEDVIELDAASHGGVDDTRDLRERVVYSPSRSRYRIYIIDEAHMVTTQGFNALLKVIEEPPEYVRFIFATTEPEKVLGTIRSRTFNYSFRLVSAGVLAGHLASVCDAEGVPYDDAALPLVATAAGGSVRDALSVLGQLIAGSGDDGLTLEYVAAGLGLTDAVLLNRVISAIAARDGAAAFAGVDAVIESGHDGRRFLTDLLSRLRDLIILQHVPADRQAGLLQLPQDQIEAMQAQAGLFGAAELSRAADLVSEGLSELKGATAPRLQLELLLARLLLPAADHDEAGFAARLDRLERSAAAGALHEPAPSRPVAPPTRPVAESPRQAGATAAGSARPAQQAVPAEPVAKSGTAGPAPDVLAAPTGQRSPAAGSVPATQPQQAPPGRQQATATPPPKLSALAPATAAGSDRVASGAAPTADNAGHHPGDGAKRREATRAPSGASAVPPAEPEQPAPVGSERKEQDAAPGGGVTQVAQRWPDVLAELGARSRVAWTLWESSTPVSLSDGVLTVEVADQGRLASIRSSRRDELLRQVLIDVLRLDAKVDPVKAAPTGPGQPAGEPPMDASEDDPDLGRAEESGEDLVIRELGAVRIGEIGDA